MPKKKNSDVKFLSGALMGAVLGVAVGLFASSETGKKAVKKTKDKTTEFYKFLLPKLKKAKNMSEKEYKEFLNATLEGYQKVKKLNKADITKIKKNAHKTWTHFKKHL